jgi:hypothetical protein
MLNIGSKRNQVVSFLNGRSFHYILQVTALLVFTSISLGMVFSRGVCCADDSIHAVAGKSMANGLGFSFTLQVDKESYTVRPFDPNVSVGPPLIIPAAIAIQLVGNTYWAPGLATVFVWLILLIIIGRYVNKVSPNASGVTAATVVFFVFSYLFFKLHFAQWYSLLGEIPAALFIILAILVFFDRDSDQNRLLAGVLFSLATLTKTLALLAFASFFAVVSAYYLAHIKTRFRLASKDLAKQAAVLAMGFVIPLAFYEIWKLVNLGVAGDVQFWREFILRLGSIGFGSFNVTLFSRYTQGIQTIMDRFGIYLPSLLPMLTVIAFLTKIDRKIFRLFLVVTAVISVFTAYWLFLSNGQARYYIISLVLVIFVLVLPFLSSGKNSRHLVVYTILLAALSFGAWKDIFFPLTYDGARLYNPSANTVALLQVKSWLSSRLDQRPFVTQWWATAADIEYILDESLNFTTSKDPELDLESPFVIAINSKFLNTADQEFMMLMERCDLQEYGPYVLGECFR